MTCKDDPDMFCLPNEWTAEHLWILGILLVMFVLSPVWTVLVETLMDFIRNYREERSARCQKKKS